MQEDIISFEEIGKEETIHAEQPQTLFKQPIRGRYQGLHAELKARCAPENFMNPYEPEKVSKANELYSEVLHTDAQADEQLKQLRLRAIEELGIKFSTEELFDRLSAACNPKNFTGESYNKERLELSNRLYQAVLMNADNVLALEEIEGEARGLLEEYHGEIQHFTGEQFKDCADVVWKVIVCAWIAVALVVLFSVFLVESNH
jgi:hypothetical protein